MTANPRWKRRPHGSTWGDFGPDDQLGRLNLLTPEKVRQGAAEVREGLAFCLSLPLEYPGGNVLNPRRHSPVVRPTLRGTRPNRRRKPGEERPTSAPQHRCCLPRRPRAAKDVLRRVHPDASKAVRGRPPSLRPATTSSWPPMRATSSTAASSRSPTSSSTDAQADE